MENYSRCPKCNARGSWLQKIGWDNVNKVWEHGCVLCGWRPPQRAPQPQDIAQAAETRFQRAAYAKGA